MASTPNEPDWKRPVQRWDYKYLTFNLEIQSGWLRRVWYRFQRARWHRKNPDIYQREDGSYIKTVFTDGVFDLFHANHALLLQEARAYGDRLIVGVVSDRLAESYKRVPIVPQEERLRIVQSQSCVDEAFIMDGPFVAEASRPIFADHHIDLIVYAGSSITGFGDFYDEMDRAGKLLLLPYHSGPSTSLTIDRIAKRYGSDQVPATSDQNRERTA